MKLYSPYQIGNMSESEIRKAYSNLRSIANKRLYRLQEQNLGMTARTGYRFPTIKQVQESSKSTVASELADVSKFLRDERTTVTGEKRFLNDFQELMTDKGYADLVETPEDIYRTIDFLESIREQHIDRIYASNDALDVLQEAERLNIPHDKLVENIDIFMDNLEAMERMKAPKGGGFSNRKINNLIKKWTK